MTREMERGRAASERFLDQKSLRLSYIKALSDEGILGPGKQIESNLPNMKVLAGYVYNVPTKEPYYLPVYENGAWSYSSSVGRVLDRTRFEEWKTKFYDFEGWNSDSGWPKRSALEAMGLKKVAVSSLRV